MDGIQEHMLDNLRDRHLSRVRQDIATITETAGYLLRSLEAGHLHGDHAQTIFTGAQEILARLTALEALREATEIFHAVPEGPDAPEEDLDPQRENPFSDQS